jgi:hypothetical protein
VTLATQVNIQEPINYQIAFLKAREIIGIPAEHPFSTHEGALGWAGGEWVRSVPGGFRSALDVSHNHGAPLVPDCSPGGWCDDPCEYHGSEPLAYVSVRLDTAYGYHGPSGETCSDLHREITAKLGAWLDEQGVNWWAQDEYTGEWYERTPCPVTQ